MSAASIVPHSLPTHPDQGSGRLLVASTRGRLGCHDGVDGRRQQRQGHLCLAVLHRVRAFPSSCSA